MKHTKTKEHEMKDEDRNIRNADENGELVKCAWCGESLPKGEMLKEAHLGHICRHCADGIRSRGEKLVVEEE